MQTQGSSRWGYTTVREQIAHIQIHSGDWEHFGNLRSTVAKNTRCHTCQLHFESGLSCSCSKTVSFPNTADEAYHGSKPTWWEQFGCRAEHGHEVLLLTLPVRCSLWGAAHHHLLGPTAADTASTSPHRKKCFCFEVFRKLGFDFRRLPAVNTFHWFFTGLCHLTFLWLCKHFFTSFTLAQQHCFNSSFPIRFFGYPLVLCFIKLPWPEHFWSFCSASFHTVSITA